MKQNTIKKISKILYAGLDTIAFLGIGFVLMYLGIWALSPINTPLERWDPVRCFWSGAGALTAFMISHALDQEDEP